MSDSQRGINPKGNLGVLQLFFFKLGIPKMQLFAIYIAKSAFLVGGYQPI